MIELLNITATVVLILLYFTDRNKKVCAFRLGIIDERTAINDAAREHLGTDEFWRYMDEWEKARRRFDAMPSYNHMLLKFWIWPLSRFEK